MLVRAKYYHVFMVVVTKLLFLAVSEEQCLQQIYNDELFGAVETKKGNETEQKK